MLQKKLIFCNIFFKKVVKSLLLCSFNRNLAEFLEVLHECESKFAGACAGGLVTLYYLCLCVLCEICSFCVDLCDKLFHN